MKWHGVIPAITTPFRSDLSIDLPFLARHVDWLIDAGCNGIVTCGSLGEGATLTTAEKEQVTRACVETSRGRVPIVTAVSALSTAEAVAQARTAQAAGSSALMVLPPYVYKGDWRETREHFRAVIEATPLSCMLYNNPIAYDTDVLPAQIAELATSPNLEAVKESSADVRRIAAIRAELGNRMALFLGVDDLIVEGVLAGGVGWIAGLVNALPRESVKLFELARAGRVDEARALNEWFLPLLRLDVVPKFVQLIKLVQQEVGMGNETVRPPRLPVEGAERDVILTMIRKRLANRPQ
jgi:4-hydroxy-tetrahydrodipicolinate synthase